MCRRPYTVRRRQDPMEIYDDDEFVQRFRLSKCTVAYVVTVIEDQIPETRPDLRGSDRAGTLANLAGTTRPSAGTYPGFRPGGGHPLSKGPQVIRGPPRRLGATGYQGAGAL